MDAAETTARSTRLALWAVLVIGVALVAAPFAIGMPGKASSGQAMMDDFRPLMDPANVETTASYYDDVFVPLEAVVPVVSAENTAKFQQYLAGIDAMGADAAKLIPALAQLTGGTEEQAMAYLAANFPAMAQMLQGLPQMSEDFAGLLGVMDDNVAIFQQVPAGLEHYQPLVTTMQGNVDDYADADALPSFRLLTWFFVLPGIALILASTYGLFRPRVHGFHLHLPRPHHGTA